MKIFGFEIFGKKETALAIRDEKNQEASNNMFDPKNLDPSALPDVKITKVQSPVLIFANNSMGLVLGRRTNIFQTPEYDLHEIGRIEDVESYVRQAFKKKTGLFLKEGFDYVSKNKQLNKYVQTRFTQIASATGIPHEELIRRMVRSFISRSNTILIKVRQTEASGGKIRTDLNGLKLLPIAGYFPVAPETMRVEVDGGGNVQAWKQRLPNGRQMLWDPRDVVHFTFERKEGFIFGTPTIVPVIDDIKILRKLEENIELLVHKHLFPLFQYTVGTPEMPAGMTESGEREIEVMQRQIQYMPAEGSIVTPERVQIEAIGVESKALRADSYILHFKKRVFAGLGMSEVDYGEAATSNKSTAVELSRALVDDVKDFQDAFEAQFNELIIKELLQESTFASSLDFDAIENKVELCFREIDLDKQIKMENHAADLFAKHGITWSELRAAEGLDPIIVPDDPENQDPTAFPQWHDTFWKLFAEPEKMISATKGQSSALLQAVAGSPSTAMTPSLANEQQAATQAHEIALVKAKKPPIKAKDNFLLPHYNGMRDVVLSGDITNPNNIMYIHKKLDLVAQEMHKKLNTHMFTGYINGLGPDLSATLANKVGATRRAIHDRAALIVKRLLQDIKAALRIDSDAPSARINLIFDTFKYRTDFIVDTETRKANYLGKVHRVIFGGATKGEYVVTENTCDTCKDKLHHIIHFEHYGLDNIPPHHPHCKCDMKITEVKKHG